MGGFLIYIPCLDFLYTYRCWVWMPYIPQFSLYITTCRFWSLTATGSCVTCCLPGCSATTTGISPATVLPAGFLCHIPFYIDCYNITLIFLPYICHLGLPYGCTAVLDAHYTRFSAVLSFLRFLSCLPALPGFWVLCLNTAGSRSYCIYYI